MDRLNGTACGALLAQLLGEVQRRLWLQRLGQALRIASWLVLGASIGAAISSMLSGMPDAAILWSVAGGLYLAAVLTAGGRRPAASTAAAWADRHLGGSSAYAASLEFLAGQPPGRDRAMLAHLDAWTATAAAASRQQLRATPSHWLPARALVAAVIALALASLTIGLSAGEGALRSRAPATPAGVAALPIGTDPAVDRLARQFARNAQPARAADDGSGKSGADDQGGQDAGSRGPPQRDRGAAASQPGTMEERTEPQGMATGVRSAAGGGEQAGQVDAGDDPGGITASDLRLRVERRDLDRDAAARRSSVDNATGAYQDDGGAGSGPGSGPRDATPAAVRAARLPAGRLAGVSGPAETELVNRYFEQRGRQP